MSKPFKRKKVKENILTRTLSEDELLEMDVNLKFDANKLTIRDMLFFDSIMANESGDVEEGKMNLNESNMQGMIDIIARFIYTEIDGKEYKLSVANSQAWVMSLTNEEFSEVAEILLTSSQELPNEKN